MVRHAWQITVREFAESARRNYGVELSVTSVVLAASLFLRRGERIYPVPLISEDEILPLDILRTLCRAFELPPEDFGLDPDPES